MREMNSDYGLWRGQRRSNLVKGIGLCTLGLDKKEVDGLLSVGFS